MLSALRAAAAACAPEPRVVRPATAPPVTTAIPAARAVILVELLIASAPSHGSWPDHEVRALRQESPDRGGSPAGEGVFPDLPDRATATLPARRGTAMRAHLEVWGGGPPQLAALEADRASVGRAASNDV